ncbi:uncharacterized protein PV06_11134 [Exophiala oligosperma]|uniref:Uncharacterized protein n=1 Tax=Exophiala oligosperma TaxID=215243 RepID=A0A0D2A8H4_9EURO|nr:uncharacterized protein PV06_11134 [Exophiala oligosperma]KIW36621.1 hypothetical protein PV06_11134 [Exophiala oligosperma]
MEQEQRPSVVSTWYKLPLEPSGQGYIVRMCNSMRHLQKEGNAVTVLWTPPHGVSKWQKVAEKKAQKATESKTARPPTQRPRMRSTMLNAARAKPGHHRHPTRQRRNVFEES